MLRMGKVGRVSLERGSLHWGAVQRGHIESKGGNFTLVKNRVQD